MDNPMDEAFDSAEEEAEEHSEETRDFDLEEYYEALDDPENAKDKTIGIAVTEEMHAFYRELRDSDDVDSDVTESFRDQLRKLARRHEQVFEKSMRKLEIEREY